MSNTINILSNKKIRSFLSSLLSNYELVFSNLDTINNDFQKTQANIIIVNNDRDINQINIRNIDENYLIISNLKKHELNFNKNIKLITAPLTINQLKNTIKNFLHNLKLKFYDISIDNEKITNLNNNSFCYLTKIELEILNHLIREKETSKNYIKLNILNIKSNIETNSLESHLTRIRKKMNKINTVVKIHTKNEKLIITN